MADLALGTNILRETTTQDLAAGDLDYTTSFDTDCKLAYVMVNRVGGSNAKTFNVEQVSSVGANYSVLLDSDNIGNDDSMVFAPDYPAYLPKGDEINVAMAGSAGAGTVYVTIVVTQE